MVYVDRRDAYALRTCSLTTRENFIKTVHAGQTTVAVYCGDRDTNGFWLARCEASTKQSNAVVYKANKADENWDIKKNELVLNVTWLNRVSEAKSLEFTLHMPQTITLSSILPVAAVWDKMHGNTYTLSQASHEKMCDWRDCIRSDLHKERNKLLSEVVRPAVMGSARSSFRTLPPTLQKLTTMRRNAEATAIAAAAAFGAHSAWRKSNIAMLHAGTIDEDDLPLCMMNELEAKKRSLELAEQAD